MDVAEQYVEDVLAARIVTNAYVKKAVQRHVDDLADGPKRGLYFDRDEAVWVCNSFPVLFRHTEGELAGLPFELMPWQRWIVWCVFGWKHKKTGLRRFRRVYIEVARRNGKSTLLAAIALFMMLMDGEPSAQVYSAATKRDQAKIVWGTASRMVRANSELSKVVDTYRDHLACRDTESVFVPLGADSKTLDGLNIHCAVVDELHAHSSPDVWQLIDTATGSRQQPIIWIITTAGFNQNGICFDIRQSVIDILNKTTHSDAWFGFVAGLDNGDRFDDETVWEKANPNLPYISTLLDDLREKAQRASYSAAAMNNFLVKCMSRWTSQSTRWLKLEDWDKCKAVPPFTYDEMKGRTVVVGLDLAEKLDLTAAVLCFPPQGDETVHRYLWKFFLPQDTVDRYIAEDRRWQEWVDSGELTVTGGARTDYNEVRKAILQWQEDFDLRLCAFDPHMATQLQEQLQDAGIEMVEINQRTGMSEGTREFEAQILTAGMIHNCGQRSLMRWQVDNVALDTHDGRCRPVRPQKNMNKRKIDGVVAAVMACEAAVRVPLNTDTSWAVFTL